MEVLRSQGTDRVKKYHSLFAPDQEKSRKLGLDLSDQISVQAFLEKEQKRSYHQQKASRLEEYKKWFLTLPQRQEMLLKQLRGDYGEHKNRERALALFRLLSIRRASYFEKMFPSKSGITISDYLPRMAGGLGLIPPVDHTFTPLDCAVFQICKEDPVLAFQRATRAAPGLTRSPMMMGISQLVTKVRKSLKHEPTMMTIPEWDEHLERHGEEETPFGLRTIAGFSCHEVYTSEEDMLALLEERNNPEVIRIERELIRCARKRVARWERELGGSGKIPIGVDLCDRKRFEVLCTLRAVYPELRLPS
jgi:hypothetical protein